jgi:hypothetical protein
MLSKREKVLVNVLLWVVALVVLGFLFAATLERRSGLREKISGLEKQIPQFDAHAASEAQLAARKRELQSELSSERSHFYEEGQIDPYHFGILVRDLLVANHLSIKQYQTLNPGKQVLLEFSVTGDDLDVVKFWQAVSGSAKYWSVPYLSIDARAGSGNVDAVFRIGYETLASLGS